MTQMTEACKQLNSEKTLEVEKEYNSQGVEGTTQTKRGLHYLNTWIYRSPIRTSTSRDAEGGVG